MILSGSDEWRKPASRVAYAVEEGDVKCVRVSAADPLTKITKFGILIVATHRHET